MIVTTTENIPEAQVVKTIGQVFGLTVRSRSLGGNIAAALKSLAGGEIRSYVKLNEDSRRQALDRMVQNAAAMGANAVTMMRFDSTEMGRGASMSVVEWVVLVVVIAGTVIALFGWDRYRGKRKGVGDSSASQPTGEVFIDPETGRRMRVWYDPSTGKREYRPE